MSLLLVICRPVTNQKHILRPKQLRKDTFSHRNDWLKPFG